MPTDPMCPWCEEHPLRIWRQASKSVRNGSSSAYSKEGVVLRCNGLIGCPDVTGVCETEAEAWGYYNELMGHAPAKENAHA